MPLDTMTWSQFRSLVDKALADAHLEDAPIWYIDFSFPRAPNSQPGPDDDLNIFLGPEFGGPCLVVT